MIAKINAFLQAIAAAVLSILPDSPVRPFIDQLGSIEWLGLLNWFVPVGTMAAIGAAWLGAITVFYIYQVILRWAKVASSS
ncbi:MAG: hypothetical protein ACOX66_03905 [Oscillospiraceae bacterium]|jgi:hypothetical protein